MSSVLNFFIFSFFSVLENLMTFWESFVVDGHNSSMGGQRNQILLASFFFRPSLPYRKFMGGLSLCITPIKPANIWWLSLMVENLRLSGWIHPWNLDLYPFLTEDLMLFAATTISSFGHKPLQACVCVQEKQWDIRLQALRGSIFIGNSLEIVDSTKTSQRYEAWVWEVSTADFDSQPQYHSWKFHRVFIPCRAKVGEVGSKKSSGHLWTICFSCCFLMWQFPLSSIWQDLFFLEKCRKKNPRWFRMKNLEASDLVVDGCESKIYTEFTEELCQKQMFTIRIFLLRLDNWGIYGNMISFMRSQGKGTSPKRSIGFFFFKKKWLNSWSVSKLQIVGFPTPKK